MVGSVLSDRFGRILRVIRGHARRVIGPEAARRSPVSRAVYPAVETLDPAQASPLSGHVFDDDLQRLEAASLAHEPEADWGVEYGVIKASFDPLFYLSQNPDIRDHQLDPVGHYLRAGARENRDPAPWFSTAEYRRKYMKDTQEAARNPFYHFLTQGRAAGHAPRAPANFGPFCDSIGMSPLETSALVVRRMQDVRHRLRHGELGEMVMKATALDPLIGEAWRAGLKVRVPPASNAIGVRRIGHLIDLQQQADGRRSRVVIVMQDSSDAIFQRILVQMSAQVGAGEVSVISTGSDMAEVEMPSNVRSIEFRRAMPQSKEYKADRTLVEFIRSLRPQVVINLNASLMNKAMRVYGRAIGATSVVYHFLPFDPVRPRALANLGSRYYRALDLGHRVIVPAVAARHHLTTTFALPEQAIARIWVAEGVAPTVGPQTGQLQHG